MARSERFLYTPSKQQQGIPDTLPRLPLQLGLEDRVIDVVGIIDSGSTVCVMPYQFGLELGALWQQQTIPVRLAGNLAQYEARVLIVDAQIGQLPSTRLAFAWTASTEPPLLLGQMNFFIEFDLCFYRSDFAFELTTRQ